MNIDQVIASIRDVPDFPKSGVLFKDITSAMKHPEVLRFIVDDLLATGGSAAAALQLLSKFDIKSLLVSFMIELEFLNGRSKLKDVADIHAMIKF